MTQNALASSALFSVVGIRCAHAPSAAEKGTPQTTVQSETRFCERVGTLRPSRFETAESTKFETYQRPPWFNIAAFLKTPTSTATWISSQGHMRQTRYACMVPYQFYYGVGCCQTVSMTTQTNQQRTHREDYKVQILMQRIETKLAFQEKEIRDAKRTMANN
jgi:hypothetical protein